MDQEGSIGVAPEAAVPAPPPPQDSDTPQPTTSQLPEDSAASPQTHDPKDSEPAGEPGDDAKAEESAKNAEATATPEQNVSRERQEEERDFLAESILYRKLRQIKESGEKDPKYSELYFIQGLREIGQGTSWDLTSEGSTPLEIPGEEGATVREISKIDGSDGDTLQCTVRVKKEDGTYDESTENISRTDLARYQLRQEKDKIAEAFDGAERDVLELWAHPEKMGEKTADEIDGIILAGAKSAGALEAKGLSLFIQSMAQDKEEFKSLKMMLEGKNIIDEKTASAISGNFDLSQRILEQNEILDHLNAVVRSGQNSQDVQDKVQEARVRKQFYQDLLDQNGNINVVSKYFDAFRSGKVDTDMAERVNTLLRTGNVDKFMDDFFPEQKTNAQEVVEGKDREYNKKLIMDGMGIGVLALVFYVINETGKMSTKEFSGK